MLIGIAKIVIEARKFRRQPCRLAIKDQAFLDPAIFRQHGGQRGIGGIKLKVGQPDGRLDIARVAAVRKALDSTYVRMTVCFMEQELGSRLVDNPKGRKQLTEVLDDVQTLLGKVR